MERGGPKLLNIMEDGLGKDLMNAGRFCFSCEQIFASRRCLEEHECSAASYICSCGTEFTAYKDMQHHSTTHEPGHQVLDHETIKKRRIEKRIEEEEQLKRLQTGDVVWKAPKLDNVPPIPLPVKPLPQIPVTSTHVPQRPIQSAQISQVPELYPASLQASPLPNPISTKDMKNIFARVGAPTVDLWTLYQPVVLLQTMRKFNKKKPYTCGKCGQCFMSKTSLVSHHSSHVTDKVSGCIGCGLLLSSKKLVPRFHVCNAFNSNAAKYRLITAKPPIIKKLAQASARMSRSPSAEATYTQQLKSQNLSAVSQVIHASHLTSTLQVKNQNIRTYSPSNPGLHVTPSLQSKGQNASASKSYVTAPLPLKSQSPVPNAFKNSSLGLPVTPSRQLKTPMNSATGLSNRPTKTSSASNGFPCRVCHIPFETAQLLQRHKCVKAQEFMAQHVRSGKQHYKLKRVTPVATPNVAQMNGGRRHGVQVPGNMNKNQVMTVSLDERQGGVPVNRKMVVDSDDDCYVVESGPDKPAEMIYQVTSSVPIKT